MAIDTLRPNLSRGRWFRWPEVPFDMEMADLHYHVFIL